MLTIRPYKLEDKKELIDLLRLHIPQYFHRSEEKDFLLYLDCFADNYFVVEIEAQIVGCGGFNYFKEEALARISWDIIHPDFQGKGIGSALTQYRIDTIRQQAMVSLIIVRTSQWVFKFYEKMGFVLEKTEKDFWAKGFDLYQMTLRIS